MQKELVQQCSVLCLVSSAGDPTIHLAGRLSSNVDAVGDDRRSAVQQIRDCG